MDWFDPVRDLIILMAGALMGYWSQHRLEKLRAEQGRLAWERNRLEEAQARLRDERRRAYLTILEPYVAVLQQLGTGMPGGEASARLGTLEHRKAAFELKLVGTDEVVRAFNTFARYIVDAKRMPQQPAGEILRHWASLLLAIRRSVGDPDTGLDESEMILDWVDDIEVLYPELTLEERRTRLATPLSTTES